MLNREGSSQESIVFHLLKGMEPYTTLSESDVVALYRPVGEVDCGGQIEEIRRFVEEERGNIRRIKEARELARKH